jgi:hypothetical protein
MGEKGITNIVKRVQMAKYHFEAEIKSLKRLALNAEDALKEAMANVEKTKLSIVEHEHQLTAGKIADRGKAELTREQMHHRLIEGLSLVNEAQQLVNEIDQRI